MKAAIYTTYGPPEVVTIAEVPTPVPGDDEVLIRIRATTVSTADWRVRSLSLPAGFGLLARPIFGFTKPRQPILGTELAGDVAAVGKNVTRFKVGDAVFAYPGSKMGCHAEYRCLPEDAPITRKPPNLTYEEAATLSFGGTTMLDFYRRAGLKAGDRVLVNGASGTVGIAAVQLARHAGAEVTAVCGGRSEELVMSLGATQIIDYTKEDFTRNGRRYDVIVDTVGTAPYARCKGSLAAGGRLLVILGGLGALLAAPFVSMTSDKKVIAGPGAERREDIEQLAGLAEAGVLKPVIDRTYPLDQIVEAHRYVDSGRKQGSVVVVV
ncbi:MAG: NAD(P)-dependent alcohol dehydrogenase [Rhodothermales bacterium]|nr:NAD(P)-dependent alcohol dehydrogenase [Rhodothermales bacterium]